MAGRAVDEEYRYSLSSELSDDDIRQYECSICLEMWHNPKMIRCSGVHTFCEKCLEKHITAHGFRNPDTSSLSFHCPACKDIVRVPANGASGFQSNYYVSGNVQRLRENAKVECDTCPDIDHSSGRRQRATRACADCSNSLCRSCCDRHNLLFPTHNVTRLSAASFASRGPSRPAVEAGETTTARGQHSRCTTHPHEALRFYCQGSDGDKCNTVICRDCRMTDHFSHKHVKDLHEMARQSLYQLEKDASEVQTRAEALSGRIGSLQASRTIIAASKREVNTLLNARAEKLVSKIHEHRDATLACLESEAAALDKEMMEEMGVARGTHSSLMDTHRQLLNVVQQGSDVDKVVMARDMSDTLYGSDRTADREQLTADPATVASKGFLLNVAGPIDADFTEELMEELLGKIVRL